MYILGYDVGGTKISAVVGDENGHILKKITMRTMKEYGKIGVTDQLISMGEELLKKAGIKEISKIGIIFAGPVDSEKGIIISSPNIIVEFLTALIFSKTLLSIPLPLAIASRHPLLPQPHIGPFGSITICPSSPAIPCLPL